jgi:hypothetical protein
MNGTVKDMGSDGIRLDSSCTIDHVKTKNNGGDGINLTTGAHVLNSLSGNNRGTGISVDAGLIQSNIVSVNSSSGVEIGVLGIIVVATVIDNEIDRNSRFGLLNHSDSSGYARNVFFDNGAGDVSGGIQIGPNLCGTNFPNAALCP